MREKEDGKNKSIMGIWSSGPKDKEEFFHSSYELIEYLRIGERTKSKPSKGNRESGKVKQWTG